MPVWTVCLAPTGPCDLGAKCPGIMGYVQTLTLMNPAGGAAQTDFLLTTRHVLMVVLSSDAEGAVSGSNSHKLE